MRIRVNLFAFVLLLPMYVSAQQYVTINVPASFGTLSNITGINPSGTEIVGSYSDGTKENGFEFTNGAFTTLSFPAGLGQTNWTTAAGVNDAKTVVGSYFPQLPAPISPEYGMAHFNYKAYVALSAPGPKMTWLYGINNQGDVIGYYQDWNCDGTGCNRRGFLLSNGTFSTLQFPGSINTFATGINSLQEIVGNYTDSVGTHGYTWSKGAYHSFTKVNGASLSGINDSGDIVGTSSSGAFLLSGGGTLYPIVYPGATSTSVSSVANRKQNKAEVVGIYTDSNNVVHGYYAIIPVPH